MKTTFDSAAYWTNRYHDGGNSGAGSYGALAEFKAEVLNRFVAEHDVTSVIEFGCGDGAQLALAEYPAYLGFDVAENIVDTCRSQFAGDATKAFQHTSDYAWERADLTLSLDVIYHLVEDDVFHTYMAQLFASAERYVIIYASNAPSATATSSHVRHRRFTDWIETCHADFKLVDHLPNRYPKTAENPNGSYAEFFIYERIPARRHSLPAPLVYSLTSYAARFGTLEFTLRRILQQTVAPDATVLWVSPPDSNRLPQSVLDLQHEGLTIAITKDVGPYTKLVPALRRYPDAFVLTFDDDFDYPLDQAEPLVAGYTSPEVVLCRRAHRIRRAPDGNLMPYNEWDMRYDGLDSGADLLATGAGGVLYPPGVLPPATLDEEMFLALAPKSDDLWFYWMARSAGRTIERVGEPWRVQAWPGSQETGLWETNRLGGNDVAIAALREALGMPL